MIDILSMDMDELIEYVKGLGEKSFRAKQIFEWLHGKLCADFDEMSSLPKGFRDALKSECEIRIPGIKEVRESSIDGTKKYLMQLSDEECVESVLMSYEHGYSVCISSQVGCRMGCSFCASTIGGLVRSLTPSEMLGQIYAISRAENIRVSSIVVMGIGEPLDNYDNLLRFIHLITDQKGYGLSGLS